VPLALQRWQCHTATSALLGDKAKENILLIHHCADDREMPLWTENFCADSSSTDITSMCCQAALQAITGAVLWHTTCERHLHMCSARCLTRMLKGDDARVDASRLMPTLTRHVSCAHRCRMLNTYTDATGMVCALTQGVRYSHIRRTRAMHATTSHYNHHCNHY
jgi:hypothetical protein